MKMLPGRVLGNLDPKSQEIFNMDSDEAARRLLSDAPESILDIEGSFALTAHEEGRVVLARSLDHPLRYFLATLPDGPALVVADRIDGIYNYLAEHGYEAQFHPTYTRMVPAHHVTELRLVGCPKPNPTYRRFFDPPTATLPAELDLLGECYVGALFEQVRVWLQAVPEQAPLGVLFSGGIDSGAVLLAVHHQLLQLGQSPERLRAFTLSVDGSGHDFEQAREFLRRTELEKLGETIEVASASLDPFVAIEVIEDYKPLDVECATMALAVLGEIRRRYPEWRYVVDGDGGDENLKSYPIEENPALTIREVVSNSMIYQEGWGIDSLKHSLTYSGGLSRSCVRAYAPGRHYGFSTFSPFTRPALIQAAEAIPFAELTGGDRGRLYALKGEIVRRGIQRWAGIDMPVFPKRRFQYGAASQELFAARFGISAKRYREHYLRIATTLERRPVPRAGP